MRKVLILLGLFSTPLLASNTWYIRPDGGTIQQCIGKTDAPYTGGTSIQWLPNTAYALNATVVDYNGHLQKVTTAGTSANEYQPSWSTTGGTAADNGTLVWTDQGVMALNQNCAVNTIYWLQTQNNSNLAAFSPVYVAGDTVTWSGAGIDYLGENTNGPSRPGQYWLNCLINYGNCTPSSVAGVTFQGANAGNCLADSSKAKLRGINDSYVMFYAASTDTFNCLDFSDLSGCGMAGEPFGCATPTDDYAVNGLVFNNTETNIHITDVNAHGLGTGFLGPTANGFVGNRINLIGNSLSGWNTDDGGANSGQGTFKLSNFNISWNGCAEEYPLVDIYPYNGCTDDRFYLPPFAPGYGDGFGTGTETSLNGGWQLTFSTGIVSYNTQDGLDTLHVAGTGSTVTENQVLAFGNMGQQIKAGAGAQAVMTNNVIVGNCAALTQTIPGAPSGFGSHLSDICRAGDTAVVIEVIPGLPALFQDNTIFSDGDIALQEEFGTADTGTTNILKFNNNVFVGFVNPRNFGELPTPIYSVSDGGLTVLTNPGASWANNSTWQWRPSWNCPQTGESNAVCTRPGLTDENYHAYGYGNMIPLSTSSIRGAGVFLSGFPADYNGFTRTNPPDIGALQFGTSLLPPFCGDGICNGSETCSSCSVDCGSCGAGAIPYSAVMSGKQTFNGEVTIK